MIPVRVDFIKLAVSFGLGIAVGIEREFNEKPAGLKTNVLICLGSTLFTILTTHAFMNESTRDFHIAAQIVTGIGFLGAGAIMREGERVTGLTTAAVIWVVAAIGMAVGMGHYSLAGVTTVGTLLVQLALGQMDILMDHLRQRHTFKVVSKPDDQSVDAINHIFKAHRLRIMDFKIMKQDNHYHSEWRTAGPARDQDRAVRDLLKSPQVIEVIY